MPPAIPSRSGARSRPTARRRSRARCRRRFGRLPWPPGRAGRDAPSKRHAASPELRARPRHGEYRRVAAITAGHATALVKFFEEQRHPSVRSTISSTIPGGSARCCRRSAHERRLFVPAEPIQRESSPATGRPKAAGTPAGRSPSAVPPGERSCGRSRSSSSREVGSAQCRSSNFINRLSPRHRRSCRSSASNVLSFLRCGLRSSGGITLPRGKRQYLGEQGQMSPGPPSREPHLQFVELVLVELSR